MSESVDIADLFSFDGDAGAIMALVWILPVIVFVLYGQRIQLYITSGDIGKKIDKLGKYASESRGDLVAHTESALAPGLDKKIDRFLDYFTIMPVDMDPAGMVDRVRHVVRLRDDSTRTHVRALAPGMSEHEVARTQTLVEVCATLRSLHAMTTHLFLTAKRQNNYPLILPLQMILPFIMERAEALRASITAFRDSIPIGDGVGPMVVGRMMDNLTKRNVAFQTVAAESEVEGRRVILLKAHGPMPTVGRIDDALASIIKESRPDLIVMVDAAIKLEGEESGIVVHGFGAAIGGSGVERAEIESLATRENIPVYSVVVKQSVKDALSPMSLTIAKASDVAAGAVRTTIVENTKAEQLAIVIGVGNTSGVLQ